MYIYCNVEMYLSWLGVYGAPTFKRTIMFGNVLLGLANRVSGFGVQGFRVLMIRASVGCFRVPKLKFCAKPQLRKKPPISASPRI